MLIAIIALGAIVLGFLLGFLYSKSKSQNLHTQIKVLETQLEGEQAHSKQQQEQASEQLLHEKAENDKRLETQKTELSLYYKELLAAQEKRHTDAITAQQALFNEALQKTSEQLKVSTNELLKQREKEFAESSSTHLGEIVNPLKETIDKMKQTMTDSTLKQTAMSSELKVNLENMIRQSEAAKQSADELTRVFKHRSKVQGDWGETILDELLESQGLTRGIHYDTQAVIRDAEGNTIKSSEGGILRPDVILHLDQKRELIIDSKVSLTAFMDYVNAETEEDRSIYLKNHIESLQKHIKELSAKDYSSYIQAPKIKMDYVIMFVPHMEALWTALRAQPDLWRKAMEQNVFIADEQTLFAALRIINMTWTQIAQAQNHEKVYELANEMLERVGIFYKRFKDIGDSLQKAQKAYEEGEKKLLDKGPTILQTCHKLEKLGAKTQGKYPLPQFLDIEDIPEIEGTKNSEPII